MSLILILMRSQFESVNAVITIHNACMLAGSLFFLGLYSSLAYWAEAWLGNDLEAQRRQDRNELLALRRLNNIYGPLTERIPDMPLDMPSGSYRGAVDYSPRPF